MFELVVGEVGAILGALEDDHDFADAGARCLAADVESGTHHGVR